MTTDQLKAKLASLELQRGKLLDAIRQLDGAIGFCKGLIEESVKADADQSPAPEPPAG